MAKTKIIPTDVMNSSAQASSARNVVCGVVSGIYSTRWKTDSQILNRDEIGTRLGNVQNQVAQIERDIRAIYQAAENGALHYQMTENWIANMGRTIGNVNGKSGIEGNRRIYEGYFNNRKPDTVANGKISISDEQWGLLCGMKENGQNVKKEDILKVLGIEVSDEKKVFGEMSATAFLAAITVNGAKYFFGKDEIKLEDSAKGSMALDELLKNLGKTKKDIDEWLEEHDLKKKEESEKYYDEDGNEIKTDDEPDFYDRKADIFEIKEEVGATASLWTGETSVGENGKVSAELGTAEAHASISAGLYVIGDDGSKLFSPGVAAEMGVSVTAATASWKQQWLGDENLGLNTEINATIGKAEAKADANAQIFNENGKLDMQLGASASAEAIAAEIEGKAAMNILGGEVGVKGGINVGIGAHADVGFRDGVIKCDVGASLGLGVSVDIEVDVGGMVNTVVDTASSAWDSLQDGWNSLWN